MKYELHTCVLSSGNSCDVGYLYSYHKNSIVLYFFIVIFWLKNVELKMKYCTIQEIKYLMVLKICMKIWEAL